MFSGTIEASILAAALAEYPREMCGVIADGSFHRAQNIAFDPLADFEMPPETWTAYGSVAAVVHSHPTKSVAGVVHGTPPHCPSAADMRGQIASAVPWAIVVTDGSTAMAPIWWGDHMLDEPLEGRPFRHGITDCYAAVRAWYWQRRQVRLNDYARAAEWWSFGGNLYLDNFSDAGFARVAADDAQEGDVLLMQIGRTSVPNHAVVMLGRGLIYHHPMPAPAFGARAAESLSRIEPIGNRAKFVTHVLRYYR